MILADEQLPGGGIGLTSISYTSGTTLWPVADHLGSVRDLVDNNGRIREHVVYSSFGQRLSESDWDANGNPIASNNPAAVDHVFGYTGREWDKDVGLQYNRARWYDPAQGRWLSQDPIGFTAGDVNLYRVVGNHVTGATDPSGLAKTKAEIPLTVADKEILDAVNSVVTEMEEEGWRPRSPKNPGEFGIILHRRVAVKLKGSERWVLNVYVENGTNKILSIGVHPGGGGHTEVDALCLKEGVAKPQAGDILDPNDIEGIYDVKTSSTGAIPLDQRHRLKAIRRYGIGPAGIDDSVKSVRPKRRWSEARTGFVDSPRIKNVLRLFSVLGVAGYVGGVLDTEAHAMEMDEVLKEARRIRGMQPGSQERMLATSLWLMGPVRTYLSRVVPDDTAVNIAVGVGVRKVLRDFIDPLEGGDPCADEPN